MEDIQGLKMRIPGLGGKVIAVEETQFYLLLGILHREDHDAGRV